MNYPKVRCGGSEVIPDERQESVFLAQPERSSQSPLRGVKLIGFKGL